MSVYQIDQLSEEDYEDPTYPPPPPPPPPELPESGPTPRGGPSDDVEKPPSQLIKQGNFQDRPSVPGNIIIPTTPDDSVSVAV